MNVFRSFCIGDYLVNILKDYTALISGLGLSERGAQIAQEVVRSEPERRVKSSGSKQNKAVRFPSKKMNCVIQAESFTLEFASLLVKEHDSNVFGFWDQPQGVSISYRSGRSTIRNKPTPDYFVVGSDFVGYEEWKPFAELQKIASKRPEYACFDPNRDRFFSPAYENALHGTGISFRFCTERDLPAVYVENLEFLRGYFCSLEDNSCTESDIEKVCTLLDDEKVLRLDSLLLKSPISDAVYYAIARNRIFFPLENLKLAEPSESWAFDQVGTWNKFKKLNSVGNLHSTEEVQEVSAGILRANSEKIQRAVTRLALIDRINSGELSTMQAAEVLGVTERTVRRLREKASSKDNRNQKLEVLLGADADKGNRTSRLDHRVVELITKIIEEYHQAKKAVIRHQVYLKVELQCEKEGLKSPSAVTVYKRINSILEENTLFNQKGAKAAYQKSAYRFLGKDDVATFSASRYLQYCHIDHTQLDIETLDQYGVPSGKPWISLCVDEYTGKILAFYLSYKEPSYVSLMMVLRCMVQNISALPESVVVDGGKEFQSKNFELFCAQHRVMIKSREGQPRGGGVIERMFGMTNTAFIHNLEGNTKYMKNVREIARTHNPKNNAEWRFKDLAGALNEFFETYNSSSAKKSSLCPNDLVTHSEKMFGARDFLKVVYNKDFVLSTLPFIRRHTLTVRRGKNVRANNHEYWHQEFARADRKGEKCEAKWDPMDIYHLHVFFDGRWLKCRISNRVRKAVPSERMALSEELHRESQINRQARKQGYKELAKVLDQEEKKQAVRLIEAPELDDCGEAESDLAIETPTDEDFNLWEDDVPTSTMK